MYAEATHGGPVDKNPPASAGGLCCRKIPHATGLLSPVCCVATCVLHGRLCAESLCSATREATTMRSPCTTARECGTPAPQN